MNLIVIEGLDGAGKSTQIGLLQEMLQKRGRDFRYVHFPRTGSPYFGELISRFLRGEFGKLEDVNPYLVAMMYAGDRKDSAGEIREWLNEGLYVLLDRYVYSNIAYQCAKVEEGRERERLKNWILDLEFSHFAIPRPDLNIFLDVPVSFTASKLKAGRQGNDRSYLNGREDIHEKDIQFQLRVRDIYIETAGKDADLEIVSCLDEEGAMVSQDEVFSRIRELLENRRLLK